MKKILLVSPHFDDAVLSAGQFMADRPDSEVVTVFAGYPEDAENLKTPYDLKCGFKNALDAVSQRRIENDQALALLEATVIDLDFLDEQYHRNVSLGEVTRALQELVDKGAYEFIMGPLGLGHPDHVLVCQAMFMLRTELPIYLWEDLPLRVVDPPLVPERIKQIARPMTLMNPATTNYKIAKKIRSMLCYKSQINTGILDPYIMYVPERFWKYQ